MSQVTASDALKLLSVAGGLLLNAKQGYDEARALAKKAGVSEEDMDKADGRFARVYEDPLKKQGGSQTGGVTTCPLPPASSPYGVEYDTDPKTHATWTLEFNPNDIRWKLASGKYIVTQHGVGAGEQNIEGITRLGRFNEIGRAHV